MAAGIVKKIAWVLVVSGIVLFAYACTMSSYTNHEVFIDKYMQLKDGQSDEYWKLRDSMLTNKFSFQDYGITLVALGLLAVYFCSRGLRSPVRGWVLLVLAIAAPFVSVAGFVGDLFLGYSRDEFPWWEDSLGIPLMGTPLLLLLLLVWSGLHLAVFYKGFHPDVLLQKAISRNGSYWLLGLSVITAVLVVLSAVEGDYYYALPGILWLYIYLSLGAGWIPVMPKPSATPES